MRKNEVEIIVNPSSKWISKGHPYLEECDKDRSGITKNTGLQHVYEKLKKTAQVHVLEELILMVLRGWNHCFHFCQFAPSVSSFVAKSL
jgi:hypothetical protein